MANLHNLANRSEIVNETLTRYYLNMKMKAIFFKNKHSKRLIQRWNKVIKNEFDKMIN